jgi:hypothetical protein
MVVPWSQALGMLARHFCVSVWWWWTLKNTHAQHTHTHTHQKKIEIFFCSFYIYYSLFCARSRWWTWINLNILYVVSSIYWWREAVWSNNNKESPPIINVIVSCESCPAVKTTSQTKLRKKVTTNNSKNAKIIQSLRWTIWYWNILAETSWCCRVVIDIIIAINRQ